MTGLQVCRFRTARTACSRTEIKSTCRCVCISACLCAACCCEIVAQSICLSLHVVCSSALFLPSPAFFFPSVNPPCPCPSVPSSQLLSPADPFSGETPTALTPCPSPQGKEKIPILSWPVAGPLSHAHVHPNANALAHARGSRSTDVKVPKPSRSSRVRVIVRGGQTTSTPPHHATRHDTTRQTSILHTPTAAVSGSVSSKALASRLAALSTGTRASTTSPRARRCRRAHSPPAADASSRLSCSHSRPSPLPSLPPRHRASRPSPLDPPSELPPSHNLELPRRLS